MPGVIAFDIYGTVIDLDGLIGHLETIFASRAREAAQLWRDKQIEYSFRRALMRKYADFGVCTAQALTYAGQQLNVRVNEEHKRALLEGYLSLPAYPDVEVAFQALMRSGHNLVALTNGVEESIRTLLRNAGLEHYLEAIVSVDRIKSFKPNPDVYDLLVRSVERPAAMIWLVSANPWDVIGGKAYGLKTVWLKRDPKRAFDPWEFSPDLTVPSLENLCAEIDLRMQRDWLPSSDGLWRPAG